MTIRPASGKICAFSLAGRIFVEDKSGDAQLHNVYQYLIVRSVTC